MPIIQKHYWRDQETIRAARLAGWPQWAGKDWHQRAGKKIAKTAPISGCGPPDARRCEIRSRCWIANSLAGDLGANACAKRGDAAANGGHHNDAQAHDACGQNDPVNGYCASFVICKGFEDVQEVHDFSLSQGLL